ncbi:hypothetical protein R6Z07F_009676 [Ovis aries]
MDSPIDCVLLECGHMVTCTKCGKRMNECPICRHVGVSFRRRHLAPNVGLDGTERDLGSIEIGEVAE